MSKNAWKCTYCDNLNNPEHRKCEICEAEKSKLEHKSISIEDLRINYRDGDEEDEIMIDIQNKKPSLKRPHMKPYQVNIDYVPWACMKCTMLNNYEVEKCIACGECGPRHDKWRCDKCTMLNANLDHNCSACFSVNPLLTCCPQCHITLINSKYNQICEQCNNKNYFMEKDSGQKCGNARVEKWSCVKCSLLNPFDLEKCAACDHVGFHHNKWRCDKCTIFNENITRYCTTCGFMRPWQTARNIEQKEKQLMQEMPKGFNKNNQQFCKNCQRVFIDSDQQLCPGCREDYFVCPNEKCEKNVGPRKMECDYCGIKIWRCSWKKCKRFNNENRGLCSECCCFRNFSNKRSECFKCGWIKANDTVCAKCGGYS